MVSMQAELLNTKGPLGNSEPEGAGPGRPLVPSGSGFSILRRGSYIFQGKRTEKVEECLWSEVF